MFDASLQSRPGVNIDVFDARMTLQVDCRIHYNSEYSLRGVGWEHGAAPGRSRHSLRLALLSSPVVSLIMGEIFLSLIYSDAQLIVKERQVVTAAATLSRQSSMVAGSSHGD